jgi:hypothetical protein
MRKLILLCAALCSMVLLFAASPAQAVQVLWVASNGNDANNCFVTSPCATFQGAINKGSVVKINCLNSGDYGAFTITTSIIIDCGAGNIGNVNQFTSGSNGITINTSSTATIVLRHLSLDGNNSASNGISANSFAGGTLVVEDCTIQGFAGGNGIVFQPTAGRGLLQVSDTRSFNNFRGIAIAPLNDQIASVTLNRVELTGNLTDGLLLFSAVVAGTMRDSVVGGNGNDGRFAQATQVFFTVEESSIVANLSAGIETNSPGSIVNVAASTIGGNGTGVKPTSGSLISFGDNHISANGTDGNFTSTTALR